ncbi:hypothetical protein BGZ98_008790 [Dissophora globulifera]|nr:hypothetical protein BGZ98_008790 [Dissophora globulifera]
MAQIPVYPQESFLVTLNPAPAVSVGMNATASRPYGPSTVRPQEQRTQSYPSSIEEQSSLTEHDATTARPLSGQRVHATPSPVAHSASGFGHSGSVGQPNTSQPLLQGNSQQQQQQQHQERPPYISAIEKQSSLTEVDRLSFPIEAQSSLTVIDNLPYSLEEQSALTEVDNLPHPLMEQSALTEVDNLPHSLKEQSALTVVDNLPYSLEEQSALTEVSSPSHPLSRKSPLTEVAEPAAVSVRVRDISITDGVKVKDTAEPTSVSSISTAAATTPATTFSAVDASNTTESASSLPTVNLAMKALSDAVSSFSMSNWTMPSDFTDIATESAAVVDAKPEIDDYLQESRSTLQNSSSATIHSDNDLAGDISKLHVDRTEPSSILIPSNPVVASTTSPKGPRNSSGLTPPIPALKPTYLQSPLSKHPQSGIQGAKLTESDEIRIDWTAELTAAAADGGVLIPLQNESLAEGGMALNDDEDFGDDLEKTIRELQSSISLSRSGSGNSSLTASIQQRSVNNIKRTDSASSKTSRFNHASTTLASESLETEPTVSESVESQDTPGSDLQQLETTQFEWTFSDTEQTTYERIFSLWERPGEECVSSDIAGKVFMTLGITNKDLHHIWRLLNPDEKPVLTRREFIAGLHLVNCKLMGYEFPKELPDDLMISAAAVSRSVLPARPVQGPSTIIPGYAEQEVISVEAPIVPIPPPSVANYESGGMGGLSAGIDFMNAYNVSLPSFGESAPPAVPSADAPPANMDVYPPSLTPSDSRASPVPAPRPPVTQTAKSNTSGVAATSASSEASNQPSKPGPHALHDLPENAPVFVAMEDRLLSRNHDPFTSPVSQPSPSTGALGIINLGATSSTAGPSNVAQDDSPIGDANLYVSPPDAWDHEAAPPELDVEGNYIKYRSDYKNDMTVSASVTANHPINPKSDVFYFEITVDNFKGSAISVGIASKSLRKNCQVGWDMNSWGYHGDDGRLYFGNGEQFMEYAGFTYKQDDVVGCGVNFVDRAVFFTLNGDMLGVAFRFIKDNTPLYPAIGLSHAGTVVNANFGDQTFLFNIVDYKKRVMSKPVQSQPMITWNNGTRNKKLFTIMPDGLTVIANGNDPGCIRGPKLSPRDRDVFYFEVTIQHMPVTELGTIMVGICGKGQSMSEILGWMNNSYGYSSESGDFLSVSSNRSSLNARSQSGKMKARARGPPYRAGSVVGCGVDFASRELFFTFNGECLGQAFFDIDVLDCYPCVSIVDGGSAAKDNFSHGSGNTTLSSVGAGAMNGSSLTATDGTTSGPGLLALNERIGFEFKANFGQSPFLFDLRAFEATEGQ